MTAALAVFAAAPTVGCPLSTGSRVVLASQELDPDVFLWDSRASLVSYVQGDYDVSRVLKHTLLVRAFTKAMVLGCRDVELKSDPGSTSPSPSFLVGVKLTGGTMRGRSGWVSAFDVRRPDGSVVTSAGGS